MSTPPASPAALAVEATTAGMSDVDLKIDSFAVSERTLALTMLVASLKQELEDERVRSTRKVRVLMSAMLLSSLFALLYIGALQESQC